MITLPAGDAEFYRVIFETTKTAIAIVENDLTISLVNPEFEYFFDASKESIEGRMSLLDFMAEVDKQRVVGYHRARRDGSSFAPNAYEAQVRDRSGIIRHALISAALIKGSNRKVLSLLDISGRKESETLLAKS